MLSLGWSFCSSNNSSPDDSIDGWNDGDSIMYILSNSNIRKETKAAIISHESFKGKFVGSNIINLSRK